MHRAAHIAQVRATGMQTAEDGPSHTPTVTAIHLTRHGARYGRRAYARPDIGMHRHGRAEYGSYDEYIASNEVGETRAG